MILVTQKTANGIKICPVTDFCALNQLTKRFVYPLPLIDETLDMLGGANFFTTMNCISGFWQVKVDPADQEKTGFSTLGGHYHYLRMPFGLINTPNTFAKLMNDTLARLINQICIVYLDGIIVFSKTDEEHISNLRLVFNRLRAANRMMKPEKCNFMLRTVNYLEYVISEDGIRPDKDKIAIIKEYLARKTVKEIHQFIGLVSYYRRFIPNFSKIAQSLTELTKKDVTFEWNEIREKAFVELHEALCDNPVLKYPDFSLSFFEICNSSGTAMDAVLSQKINGSDHPIFYISQKLNKAERNYSTTERECPCVFLVLKKWHYLYGCKFTVVTDHRPLRWLLQIKEPTSHLARWYLLLSEYDFEIIHKAGKANANADVLSRIPAHLVTPPYEPVACVGQGTDKARARKRPENI
ncbi:hypothetical protein PR048_005967 [Dryococelus australis]|uniref:Reverse transcriptase domain-containing protein n=1 Tax=Dryococelus australis TaxID=614101 RepID=A0ABQ9IAL9_9NEOP|nr:hypothetical protein PR048_005967 [Dryococelus australis]